jgi:hypothetical protein
VLQSDVSGEVPGGDVASLGDEALFGISIRWLSIEAPYPTR